METGLASGAVAFDGVALRVGGEGDGEETELAGSVASDEVEDLAVEAAKGLESPRESQFFVAGAFPVRRARCLSFRIKAVLCSTSSTRSLVMLTTDCQSQFSRKTALVCNGEHPSPLVWRCPPPSDASAGLFEVSSFIL